MTNTSIVTSTWTRPIPTPEAQPDYADMVIIGGGIVGVSAAYFLAQRGFQVVLCEKGHIACEQSGRNWGWVRRQGRAAVEVPLMTLSREIWKDWQENLGEDLGFSECGCLYLASSLSELEEHAQWLSIAEEYDVETQMLDASALSGVLSTGATHWVGAMYTPSDARAEPHLAAPAIARAAVRAGATILTGCAARGLDLQAGEVTGVVTELGTIRTNRVLCAAGAWTSTFCRSLDIGVPQLKLKGTVVRTAPTPGICDGTAYSSPAAIRRRNDGGYTIAAGSLLEHQLEPASFRWALRFLPALRREMGGIKVGLDPQFFTRLAAPRKWSLEAPSPFELERVLDPPPSQRVIKVIRKGLQRWMPEIGDVPFIEAWAGMIEASPDVLPIVSPVDLIPGFHIATGFSGHGFGIGPGAGQAAAAMVAGDKPAVDLSPFRLSRFYDGTKLELGPTI